MKVLHYFLPAFVLACISFPAFAQVSGKITDSNNAAAEGAVVSLLKASDSLMIKTTVTDKEGNFGIDKPVDGTFFHTFKI